MIKTWMNFAFDSALLCRDAQEDWLAHAEARPWRGLRSKGGAVDGDGEGIRARGGVRDAGHRRIDRKGRATLPEDRQGQQETSLPPLIQLASRTKLQQR